MIAIDKREVLVLPGDSLPAIARVVYGNADLWPLLFAANRDRLASPHHLTPGLRLRLP